MSWSAHNCEHKSIQIAWDIIIFVMLGDLTIRNFLIKCNKIARFLKEGSLLYVIVFHQFSICRGLGAKGASLLAGGASALLGIPKKRVKPTIMSWSLTIKNLKLKIVSTHTKNNIILIRVIINHNCEWSLWSLWLKLNCFLCEGLQFCVINF